MAEKRQKSEGAAEMISPEDTLDLAFDNDSEEEKKSDGIEDLTLKM